jgi:hypothetical protein
MGTGQMMLSMLAVVLLGTTILSVNRNSLNQGTILRQTELGIYAVSLATSYIQKASSLDFDEKTVGGLIYITVPMPQPPSIPTNCLKPPDSLGTDAGENKTEDDTFDDFDDYKGYSRDTLITGVDQFRVSTDVYYVNNRPPYTKVTANRTWLKQMDIKVSNSIDRKTYTGQTGTDTIRLSYIMGFYK